MSWRIEAVRNDLWNRKYGAPVVTDKSEFERGKYLHPELYGAPMEQGIDFQPPSKEKSVASNKKK